MGFACPVCEEPQVDDAHLANHLAFTAILRAGEHEAWLDEHVPDWNERGPAELGPLVADHAEAIDVEVPDEGHATPDRPTLGDPSTSGHRGRRGERSSSVEREILEEARALTRKRRENRDASESE